MTEQHAETPDDGMGRVVQFPGRDPAPERGEDIPAEVVETTTADPVERAPRPFEARPILPPWLVDAAQRRQAAKWATAYVAHATAFHGVRAPLYAARLMWRAPVGMSRMFGAAGAWVLDVDNGTLAKTLVAAGDATGHGHVTARRAERIKQRLCVAGGATGVAAIAEAVAAVEWPATQWPLLAGVVAIAGYVGRRKDRPILDSSVTISGPAPKLTGDVVLAALGSIGISAINSALSRGGVGVTFVKPITRDGPGWRADIDLPLGVTATDVAEKRDKLASGLRRPLGCVWLEPVHDAHTGRLVLWVGDRDLAQGDPPPWPLARTGSTDLFKPIPWGTDQRGRRVDVTLVESNGLVSAMPGAGKTFALRVLLLAAALDPLVQLDVFELKGSGDLSPLAPVCHDYASGGGDDAAQAALDRLREVAEDLERRAGVISRLPRSVCPDSKVTPELARRANLGLHLRVVAIDEAQQLFAHPVKEVRDEAAALCIRIIKLGRALGVILLLATQRPDKDSLPKAISANIGIRFCLRMMGHVENDMVLGAGSHRVGLRATDFTIRDRGIGWLVGASPDATILRTAKLDGPASERIAERARAAREAAGTLTGLAAGERSDDRPARDILDDLLTVLGTEDKAHADVLCARLAESWPDIYGGWGPAQLSAALSPHEIKARDQMWAPLLGEVEKKGNKTGYHRDDFTRST